MLSRRLFNSLLVAAAVTAGSPAHAALDADAVGLVEKAIATAKKDGESKLVERVNAKDSAFVTGDLYVVVRDLNGTILAHPMKSSLVGKNLNDVPDADGKLFRKDITDGAAKVGKGWVNYKSKNPVTNHVEAKKTYYQKSGSIIVEAGIYAK